MKYRKLNNNGQVILAFAFMIMVIFSFLFFIVQLSKLSRERLRIQIAADSAALGMATFQARALNAVADRNYILKYPSGNKDLRYGNTGESSYSFPGMDQIDATQYEFPSKTLFHSYMELMAPYIEQQDSFMELYERIIPRIGEDYIKRNDKDAFLYEYVVPSFDFRREKITVKYIDWEQNIGGSKMGMNELVDGWINVPDRYIYSYVRVGKKIAIWGNYFLFDAVALGEVVPKSGELWPDPKPTYKARLAPTQEKGVYH
jgi:hypothetical protein